MLKYTTDFNEDIFMLFGIATIVIKNVLIWENIDFLRQLSMQMSHKFQTRQPYSSVGLFVDITHTQKSADVSHRANIFA